jgi:hypothetical protein
MRFIVIIVAALVFASGAAASTAARQFTLPLANYEQAIAQGLNPIWKNTGTKCEFRSGRTFVYCITVSPKWGRIQSTMRRNSATTIRISVRFIDQSCPACARTWTIKGR